MNYQVHSPVSNLQPFVKCFWTLDDDGIEKPVRQRVLPDGCMEMIFHYGDLYQQYFKDGTSIVQPRSFVFGQITTYIEIVPSGITGLVAARFLPDGLTPFINLPVSSLENKAVDIIDLFGEDGKLLEEKVMAAATNPERIKLIETFLMCRLVNLQTKNTIAKNCVDIIFQKQGQLCMMELAGKLKVNRRNMERKFVSAIGMGVKQLSKVVRLQATLRMMKQKKFSSLTSLAYENGYYDQSHFIKDFKEFTGMSPKSFFSDNLELASHFISGE